MSGGNPSSGRRVEDLRPPPTGRAVHAAGTTAFLTPEEHSVIRKLGHVWADICAVVGDGPTRDADLQEAIIHVHALQKMVMGQAASRAYPDDYRLLGEVLPE